MINKLTERERDNLLCKMSFYDFNSFMCLNGEELIINLKNSLGNTRYCDVMYYKYNFAIRKEYAKREKVLLMALLSIFKYYDERVSIINYEDEWIKNKKISFSLNKILLENSIGKTDALQTNDLGLIEKICRSILKGNTSAFLVLEKSEIIIFPTDHMDVFIASRYKIDKAIREAIKKSTKYNYCIIRKQ